MVEIASKPMKNSGIIKIRGSSRRREEASEYFKKNVDPVLGNIITHLLCVQPNNVLDYLNDYLSQKPLNEILDMKTNDVNKSENAIDPKLYFSRYVSPFITDLVKKIVVVKPSNILEFIIEEIPTLKQQQNSFNNSLNSSNYLPVNDKNYDSYNGSTYINNNNNFNKPPLHTNNTIRASTSSLSRMKLEEAKAFADVLVSTNPTIPETLITTNTTNEITSSSNSINNGSNSARHPISTTHTLQPSHSLSPRPTTATSSSSSRFKDKLEQAVQLENTMMIQPTYIQDLNASVTLSSSRKNLLDLPPNKLSASINLRQSFNNLKADMMIPSGDPLNTTTNSTTNNSNDNNNNNGTTIVSDYSSIIDITTTTTTTTAIQKTIKESITIQIGMFGLDKAGKSTILNSLQGIADVTKPTVGFRPICLFIDEETKIQFYDLGGGTKIRGIWNEYYHDIHSFIYTIDMSSTYDMIITSVNVLKDILNHPYIQNKPYLILANKMDIFEQNRSKYNIENTDDTSVLTDNSDDDDKKKDITIMNINDLKRLIIHTIYPDTTTTTDNTTDNNTLYEYYYQKIPLIPCTALLQNNEILDTTLEMNIDILITHIRDNYQDLNQRVENDTKFKQKEDTMKRLEREKNVLKTKIALAFYTQISSKLLSNIINKTNLENPPEVIITEKDQDIFTMEEGIAFLASEINVITLCEKGCKIAALVGYQRLALQIIGGFFAPINKKKTPLSWNEIEEIVIELRQQLGLS